jgi:hypothetical protein
MQRKFQIKPNHICYFCDGLLLSMKIEGILLVHFHEMYFDVTAE